MDSKLSQLNKVHKPLSYKNYVLIDFAFFRTIRNLPYVKNNASERNYRRRLMASTESTSAASVVLDRYCFSLNLS